MLKRIAILVGILFVLALIVFGWEKTASYLGGTRRVLNAEADDRVPMELERARIETLVSKEGEKILAFEDKLADLEGRRHDMERRVQERNSKLAAEMKLLKRIRELLGEGRDEYVIGRQTYTFAEVNADALERVAKVQQMDEAIAFDESLLAELDAAIKQGAASLGESRKRLVELRSALARLEQRNVNAEIRMQVAQLVNSIATAPLSADTELENAMLNYEHRVGSKERRATSRLTADSGQSRIDYSAVVVPQNASDEIDRFLNATGAARSPAVDPARGRPSASEVLEDARQ